MSNIHRLDEHTKTVLMLSPQVVSNTNVDGSEIDTTGWDKLAVLIAVGDIPATGDVDVKAQTGASSYTDISGAIHEAILPAGDDEVYVIDIDCNKLADRTVSVNVANAAAVDAVIGVVGVLYNGQRLPVSQENTVVAV